MLILNNHVDHGKALAEEDALHLDGAASIVVSQFLAQRDDHRPTRIVSLPALAAANKVAAVHVKDESTRFGLGSFKALGGAYAVIRLVLEAAEQTLGRPVAIGELTSPEIRAVASGLTFGCATDGNHGRSVAAGAARAGARAVIFMHERVSDERAAAIANLGAEIVRVPGTYDDSVEEAARVCAKHGWTVVSDTAWPGYERIPGLVMQGYTAIVAEALSALAVPPTHVFVQAGVGGIAAASAGYLALRFDAARPRFVVVEPDRAACIYASAEAGRLPKIDHGIPTIMSMLECYVPSLSAWRVLTRAADAFMTVAEDDAVDAMRTLAFPRDGDAPVVAGESGGVGLAGFLRVAREEKLREALGLSTSSRILVINTEGATDVARYTALVGATPETVLA